MKRLWLLVALLLLTACNEPPVLNVNGIKTDLPAYQKDRVVIEGVVSSWQGQDPKLFSIADVSEAHQPTMFVVPVHFEGARPKAGSRVRVTAKLDMQKRVFIATKVKIMS